jgi:hypothetical protein
VSEAKHTPGPWNALFDQDGSFEVECETHAIANRGPLRQKAEESIANARLIAAAPDLLHALTILHDECSVTRDGVLAVGPMIEPSEGAVLAARAAIAKAEGR